MIRVSLIEDEPEVRQELAGRLERAGGMYVEGVFASAEEAAEGLAAARPDIVVVDIQLPGRSGIELISEFKPRLSGVEFLVLTTFDDDDLVFAALEAGASGYLLKRDLAEEVVEAVRLLHLGGSPMSCSIARKVVHSFRRTSEAATDPLASREKELLDWLARGRSYKECAEAMTCSMDTIRTYIRRLYAKLHAHSRQEAIAKARRRRSR